MKFEFKPISSENNSNAATVVLGEFSSFDLKLASIKALFHENDHEQLVNQMKSYTDSFVFSRLLQINGAEEFYTFASFTVKSKVAGNNLNAQMPCFSDQISKLADTAVESIPEKFKKSNIRLIVLVSNLQKAKLAALAICRNWPLYSKKESRKELSISCQFVVSAKEQVDNETLSIWQHLADGIRLTQELMDTPCADMNVANMISNAEKLVLSLPAESKDKVTMQVIRGTELRDGGFGGLWGVGKGATVLPALVVLTYSGIPSINKTSKSIALVGKGIVFDTGGLSIKGTAGMCGMKFDKGGASAILNAFIALVKTKSPIKVSALLCLAENAVGPDSFRVDDILTLYSDAEGRLVLGDGVAYASKHLNPSVILDMATLTGAQLITTGKKHAAILTASDSIQQKLMKSGFECGDYCFPILYAPDLLFPEFKSSVADMKNSVKDRGNAQCSCAGHFVEQHLDSEYKGDWVHVDIAGPSVASERGTGYGVALIYEFVKSMEVALDS